MDTVAEMILVVRVLSAFFSVISLLSCGVNVALIIFLQKRNGYLAVLMAMAVLQAIYDASFVLYFGVHNREMNIAGSFFQTFTGLAVTLWWEINDFSNYGKLCLTFSAAQDQCARSYCVQHGYMVEVI